MCNLGRKILFTCHLTIGGQFLLNQNPLLVIEQYRGFFNRTLFRLNHTKAMLSSKLVGCSCKVGNRRIAKISVMSPIIINMPTR